MPPDPATPGAARRRQSAAPRHGGPVFEDACWRPLRTARSGGTGYDAAWYGAANRRHGSGGWSDVCLCRHGVMPPVGGMRRRPDRAGGNGAANRRHGVRCRLRPARCLVPPNGAAQNRLAKARLKTGGGPAARRPDRAGGMVPPDWAAQNGAAFWRHLPPPDSAAAGRAAGRLAGGRREGGGVARSPGGPRKDAWGRPGVGALGRPGVLPSCGTAGAARPVWCRLGMVPPRYGVAYWWRDSWRRGSWRLGVAGRERCRAAWCRLDMVPPIGGAVHGGTVSGGRFMAAGRLLSAAPLERQ